MMLAGRKRMTLKDAHLSCLSIVMCLMMSNAFADQSQDNAKKDSVVELSIVGNTELPRVNFNQPWRLPSVEKRDEQSPSEEIPSLLMPIEPERHKKMVYFSRYLEVDVPEFRTR